MANIPHRSHHHNSSRPCPKDSHLSALTGRSNPISSAIVVYDIGVAATTLWRASNASNRDR